MAHQVREQDGSQLAMFGVFGGHLRIQPDCVGKETTDRRKVNQGRCARLSSDGSGVTLLVAVFSLLACLKNRFRRDASIKEAQDIMLAGSRAAS